MSSNQKIQCRAAILYKEGTPLKIETITVDPPRPNEVRVKLVAAGICASDGHYIFGHMKLSDFMPSEKSLPAVLGHEGAGIIESVGLNVTEFKVGDHVLTSFNPECGECNQCHDTESNFCENMSLASMSIEMTDKKLLDGTQLMSITGLGIYSEYACINQKQVFKIDSSIDLKEACIISCSVCTGFFAAIKQAKVTPGSTCAVWGLGGIGLNAIYGCKYAGAKNIIGIDFNSGKKTIGMEVGCTEFINPEDLDIPVEQYLMQKYKGIDFAFDCVGNEKIIDTGLASLAFNGTMALVGVPGSTAVINYPAFQMLFGRRIVGAFLGSAKTKVAFTKVTNLYMEGKLNLKRLISNHFKLDQINDAFTMLKDRKCIRSVIVF